MGNEAADTWAKVGAFDRHEALGSAVAEMLTCNLWKAREVIRWLAREISRMAGSLARS